MAVLAQICRKTVNTAVEQMEIAANSESRAVRQRKRSALEAFGAVVDSRLFGVSAAVEDRLPLDARVRKLSRQKNDPQARWVEVWNQRERVALKCDRLRRELRGNQQAWEERRRISEATRKAKLELDRDSLVGGEALDYLLRRVAEGVTNMACGGMLHRMKFMNAQLATMVGVLDNRAG